MKQTTRYIVGQYLPVRRRKQTDYTQASIIVLGLTLLGVVVALGVLR